MKDEGKTHAVNRTEADDLTHPSSLILHPSGVTNVACAVIERADGSFLLAQRPSGKPYSGYWEFPGGKVESGESPRVALARELEEELGITVTLAYPWVTRMHSYTHATVRLHFFRVVQWNGEPHGREQQAFVWQHPHALSVAPMLPANAPIFAALALPKVYAISNATEIGEALFLAQLDTALAQGTRLIQFREKTLPEVDARRLLGEVLRRAHLQGARVLVNSAHPQEMQAMADGVHLTAADLGRSFMRGFTRPAASLAGASCHDAAELARAAELGCDFAVLGPVALTASHPGGPALGWPKFREFVDNFPLPVYAIGGMRRNDLAVAWEHGAHGIAGMRSVWGEA